MRREDVANFIFALGATLIIGTTLLVGVFRLIAMRFPSDQGGPAAGPPSEKAIEEKKKALPSKIPQPKRHIPAGAAKALVDRGHRLREEKDFEGALKCYLSLLYSAVEEGGSGSLPIHLTDCLRGAAESYKGLGDYNNAVRFLQAERMIYEEMVAQEQKLKQNISGSKQILKTLFAGKDPSAQPRRCEVLTGVAEASAKYGYNDLGLSYRVKAAALKHRLEGKPLDPSSPEFLAIAEALEKLAPKEQEEVKEILHSDAIPGASDLVGKEPAAPRGKKAAKRKPAPKAASQGDEQE